MNQLITHFVLELDLSLAENSPISAGRRMEIPSGGAFFPPPFSLSLDPPTTRPLSLSLSGFFFPLWPQKKSEGKGELSKQESHLHAIDPPQRERE